MDPHLYKFGHTISVTANSTKINNIVWQIPNFAWLLNNQTNREIIMNTAKAKNDKTMGAPVDDDAKFQVKIKFVGCLNDLLEVYYLTPINMFVKAVLSVWSEREGGYIVRCNEDYRWVGKTRRWKLLIVFFKQGLIAENLHRDGSMLLKLEIHTRKRDAKVASVALGPEFTEMTEVNKAKSYLVSDLESLIGDSNSSDVIIKSVEGVELKAHKIILIARSIVLRAHFQHNTVESSTNVIETPLEIETLQAILTYIYTENVPNIDKDCEKLLAAADYYQLDGLKILCESALSKKLTVNNAIETLELANLHSAPNLKKDIFEYIQNEGLTKAIIKTQGWANLTSVAIAKSLYEYNIAYN